MHIDLAAGEVCLNDQQPLRLHNAAGQLIRCLDGILWITLYGDATDYFLHPGESLRISNNGLVLVSGSKHGRLAFGEIQSRAVVPNWLTTLFGHRRPCGNGRHFVHS